MKIAVICARGSSCGESIISYADYAIAMVDEALKGNHIQ